MKKWFGLSSRKLRRQHITCVRFSDPVPMNEPQKNIRGIVLSTVNGVVPHDRQYNYSVLSFGPLEEVSFVFGEGSEKAFRIKSLNEDDLVAYNFYSRYISILNVI